ncbi:hypothetical protein KF840_12815 [bacterium]|nr:hypothetical protein [bacterium]
MPQATEPDAAQTDRVQDAGELLRRTAAIAWRATAEKMNAAAISSAPLPGGSQIRDPRIHDGSEHFDNLPGRRVTSPVIEPLSLAV